MIDWWEIPDLTRWVSSHIIRDQRLSVMWLWTQQVGPEPHAPIKHLVIFLCHYFMIFCCFLCIRCIKTSFIEEFNVNYILLWMKIVQTMWYTFFQKGIAHGKNVTWHGHVTWTCGHLVCLCMQHFFSFKCTLPTLNKIWFDLIWFDIMHITCYSMWLLATMA